MNFFDYLPSSVWLYVTPVKNCFGYATAKPLHPLSKYKEFTMVLSYTIYCAYLLSNVTKQIRKNYLAKLRVYWIFVTKQMDLDNFQLQTEGGDENCCQRTISICLKFKISITNVQAMSKSNMFDQIVSVFISS